MTADSPRVRYHSLIADSARWDGFALRAGDIVVTTPPKSGTTWTQMLCALLVFDGPVFPQPLEKLSPWLDMLNRPLAEVKALYAAQTHRRFIKTHTPLDGLPLRRDVTYVVVGRDPRDVAISMEHHMRNLDFESFMARRANAVGTADLVDLPPRLPPSADPAERFDNFVNETVLTGTANLAMVLHHLHLAWRHRAEPNVAIFHYADLRADLPGELRRLAAAVGIELSAARAAELAGEASLERMRARAADVVPGASLGQWRSVEAFLRAGSAGEWRERVSEAHLDAYHRRVAELVPPDLAAWVHGGRIASGVDPGGGRASGVDSVRA
jgi:aryl sulfotransferase